MQQTFVVPYLRSSPLHDARRDLVLHSAESLSLRMTVLEQDDPNAQLLIITGGLGGPAAHLTIWQDYDAGCRSCDYGRPPLRGATLWSGWGTPQPGLGSFDWHIPAGTLYSLPPRCGWAGVLVWDDGMRADTMFEGVLQVRGRFVATAPADAVLTLCTSTGIPILTADGRYIIT